MAGLRRPQSGAYRRTAAAVNLLLGVFQVLLSCCRPGGAQGQAIEPMPNVVELWQAEEGELLLPTQGDSEEDMEEPSQEQSFSEKLFIGKGLHFQPSVLDFGIQFLGHPAAKLLYVYNPSRDSEVVVNSMFTAAGHFHVPPVHCRVIPAMGRTSFRIIFLPTEEGTIESSLFINTSTHGVLSYHVSGVGTRRVSTEGSAEQLPNTYFLLPQVQSIQLSQTQSCYLGPGDALPLEMSIVVAVENSSRQPEENTQALLDHLSIVYVATAESDTTETPTWDGSLSLDRSTWHVDSELANELYERWKKYKNGNVCRRNVLGMTQFASAKKSKESEPFVSFLPRLVLEPGLLLNFSATALRNSVVKYFVVRNPSPRPVSLQLLPLSLYPKPEAAVRLLHKWFGTDMQTINFTTGEFQLTKACPYQGEPSEESSFGMLHLYLQPLEMRRVGVVFTPVDYGKVTSLILIRNNLTVIDMVGVEGFGAQELLKVGGRLPGAGGSLRFKVPESTLMDCRRQLKDSKQILSITKNFKVENVGPLPVTVTSLKINGYNCQGYGFQVLDCHPFSLNPNTSRDISIVFTPDFTSSWVIRELMLVTAADLEFHFTLNVTLPHHMLPVCAEVVPGPSWEESFWRLTVFFVRNNCKNFLDTYSPSDKSRGKSCLPVGPPLSRIQNAAKRSPATYGHSQKKHKCSFYYSKQKASASMASSANIATEEKQTLTLASSLSAVKEDACTDVMSENWVSLKYASGVNVNLQKNLTLPKNVLNKEENSLKNTLVNNTSSECTVKEGIQTCMFPKETDIKTSENVVELKEQEEPCPQKTSKKPPETPLPKSPPQYQQSDMPEVSRKHVFGDLAVANSDIGVHIEIVLGGDGVSSQDFSPEASILVNLSKHMCSPTDVSSLSQFTESSSPSLPAAPSGAGEEKGLYPPGGLWPSQPVCLTSSFNCPAENSAPGVSQGPASIPDSFIDWSASCEGQFPSVYCPLELNDYNAFPEENMNYANGFPCPSKVQTDFIGHSAHSTWNTPASTPTTWEHAGFVNSPSYLTSTRSLSPMSGLFGSIWAPQSDVYENCCPVSPATEHSTHMENQVMCKEYYPGFNPFRAYMNLDIWTSTANRNANFPLSRDSSYCGNA
ncbi:transmembrane 131 like [Cricetulus griseus]